VVSDGQTDAVWDYEKPVHVNSLTSWESEFFFSMKETFGSQAYNAPLVTSSDTSIVRVHATGEASNGNILSESGTFQALKVIHTCMGSTGEAKVTVLVELGAFAPIKFSWIKNCEKTGGLFVSTEKGGAPNVVKESITADDWAAEKPAKKILVGETQTVFFLSSTSAMRVSNPQVAVKPHHVMRAEISGDLVYGGQIVKNQYAELQVDYKCMQKGTAVVTVTIPFSEHHHPIEFSWIKECPKFVKKKKIGASWLYDR